MSEAHSPNYFKSASRYGVYLGLLLILMQTIQYLAGIYVVIELWAALQANPNDNIAHYAHLGGMLFGFIMVRWFYRNEA